MIAEFLERLTTRKNEVARTASSEWQALVLDVADGKEIDPDAVLSDLDRLGKAPEDLVKAVALLSQRRGWAATVAAGAEAEVEHPRIKKTIDAEVVAFKVLEEEIIPKLFAYKPVGGVVRVWSAGCSTGEEAYSLAILLQERMKQLKHNYTVQVFATDIDDRAIATARAGLYPASIPIIQAIWGLIQTATSPPTWMSMAMELSLGPMARQAWFFGAVCISTSPRRRQTRMEWNNTPFSERPITSLTATSLTAPRLGA